MRTTPTTVASRSGVPSRLIPTLALGCLAAAAIVIGGGCGQSVEVGTNLVWVARYENGSDPLAEWRTPSLVLPSTAASGSDAGAAPIAAAISGGISPPSGGSMVGGTSAGDPTHGGSAGAAKLTVVGATNGVQQNTSLTLSGTLPHDAYYSSWYEVPSVASVGAGGFWVIMKIRRRDAAGTESELYDFDLANTAADGGGASNDQMSLRFYDWDTNSGDSGSLVQNASLIVRAGTWFHLEVHYVNATGMDGHLSAWLDGVLILDRAGPSATTSWAAWEVSSVAKNLTPSSVTLYVDDSAVGLTRVGPTGRLPN